MQHSPYIKLVKGAILRAIPKPYKAMASIQDQIQFYRSERTDAWSKGDQANARKLQQRNQELKQVEQRHPEAAEARSPQGVVCALNPSNIKCRVYDD